MVKFLSRLQGLVTAGWVAACAVVVSTAAFAQTWPDRAIRFVVPYTPGGGTDAMTRQLADRITQDLKWIFVVDNRPGAGGNVGMDVVAKAKPDGYTLGMGQTSNLAINPAAMAKMPFDSVRDLMPAALVAEIPTILVVRSDSPWRTLGDLVRSAKAKPEEVKQALAGTGTVGHLAGEMLARQAGVKFLNVPYKGAAPALTDLLGGQTDCMFVTPPSVMGMLQGGKLRALAVTSTKRLPVLPDIPTVAEQGYAKFQAVDWKAVVVPAGTSAEIVERINAATQKALKNPVLVAKLAEEGSTPILGSVADTIKYIRTEQAEWGALIRDAGLKFE